MYYLTKTAEAFALLFQGADLVWAIILFSLRISAVAVGAALVVAVPLGYWLGSRHHIGKRFLMVFVNTGMALPPVAVGLFVYVFVSRRGPMGPLELLYTPTAMIIAQVVIAFPLIAGVTAAAVSAVPRGLRLQARSLGASRAQEAWAVLKEAKVGMLAAVAAGFGGVISEVGAVRMLGGNIRGQTQTMTTFIMEETGKGEYGSAIALAIVLLTIALLINVLLTWVQQKGEADVFD